MSNSELTNRESGGLLEKGLDVMRNPNSSKAAKAGAVALVSIASIGVIAKKTLDIIGNDK